MPRRRPRRRCSGTSSVSLTGWCRACTHAHARARAHTHAHTRTRTHARVHTRTRARTGLREPLAGGRRRERRVLQTDPALFDRRVDALQERHALARTHIHTHARARANTHTHTHTHTHTRSLWSAGMFLTSVSFGETTINFTPFLTEVRVAVRARACACVCFASTTARPRGADTRSDQGLSGANDRHGPAGTPTHARARTRAHIRASTYARAHSRARARARRCRG